VFILLTIVLPPQALDSTHRAAVAALIHKQAHDHDQPTQFITSTFRPEMVNVADKHYGITHQNKVSEVKVLTKEDSLDVIADVMNEEGVGDEEAVEDVPVAPARKTKTKGSKRHKSGAAK
jgi:structural maintenance of chromosome 3 (chondroitin sulfate proteoglycan 6)